MKVVFAGTCFAMALAVGAAAQTPAATAPSEAQEQKDAKTVTVTGCLRAGEQPETFILANLKFDEQAKAGEPVGTTGIPAEFRELENATVRLVGAPADVKLKEHVGHTVQVTGMITDDRAKTRPALAGTAGEPAAAAGETGKPKKSLNVRTMRHVSPDCKE